MTRIAFLSHSAADAGAEQGIVHRIGAWPAPADRPVLVLAEHGPIESRARARGVDHLVVSLGARRSRRQPGRRRLSGRRRGLLDMLRHAPMVAAALGALRADVVVVSSIRSLVFGWLAGRRCRSTVVWSLHDRVTTASFPAYATFFLRYVAPLLVDGIVANSRSSLATIRPGRTPTVVVAPAIALDARPFAPPGKQVRRVVMLGRLAPWKGQDVFLRAFATAFRGSQTQAFLVGGPLFGESDYEGELRALARSLGIEDRVRFVGHVEDPWEWLVDADVLVHASRIPEPFGQVVPQGLWARCAVVATTPGGPAEVITDGLDGLLVPCDDAHALARALGRLRREPGLSGRLAANGRATARAYGAATTTPRLRDWLLALHDRRNQDLQGRSPTALGRPGRPDGHARSLLS